LTSSRARYCLPPSRLSVLTDPAIEAKFPFTAILGKQAEGQLQWLRSVSGHRQGVRGRPE
jgi:hypothetical protein